MLVNAKPSALEFLVEPSDSRAYDSDKQFSHIEIGWTFLC